MVVLYTNLTFCNFLIIGNWRWWGAIGKCECGANLSCFCSYCTFALAKTNAYCVNLRQYVQDIFYFVNYIILVKFWNCSLLMFIFWMWILNFDQCARSHPNFFFEWKILISTVTNRWNLCQDTLYQRLSASW